MSSIIKLQLYQQKWRFNEKFCNYICRFIAPSQISLQSNVFDSQILKIRSLVLSSFTIERFKKVVTREFSTWFYMETTPQL